VGHIQAGRDEGLLVAWPRGLADDQFIRRPVDGQEHVTSGIPVQIDNRALGMPGGLQGADGQIELPYRAVAPRDKESIADDDQITGAHRGHPPGARLRGRRAEGLTGEGRREEGDDHSHHQGSESAHRATPSAAGDSRRTG